MFLVALSCLLIVAFNATISGGFPQVEDDNYARKIISWAEFIRLNQGGVQLNQ